VFSENATKIELCLFADDGKRETARLALPEKSGPVWHGYLPGLEPGALYGLRAHGPFAPERGHRFNPHKLLLDPYARALTGRVTASDATLGYDPAAPDLDLSFSTVDSAPAMPKAVVTATPDALPVGERPGIPWDETVLYEAHLKGLTQRWPELPDSIRGSYDALASDPVIEHLVSPWSTTAGWWKKASATTGATTPSASSRPSRATSARQGLPASARWCGACMAPASR